MLGNFFSFSSYTSFSYFKQHINLPQLPDIFEGFNEIFSDRLGICHAKGYSERGLLQPSNKSQCFSTLKKMHM